MDAYIHRVSDTLDLHVMPPVRLWRRVDDHTVGIVRSQRLIKRRPGTDEDAGLGAVAHNAHVQLQDEI